MGADCRLDDDGLTVRGGGAIHGVDVDLRDTSELMPTLAVVAALADSPSTLRGIGHMRGHETDRLAAIARELNALGGDVTEASDSLTIRPKRLRGGVFTRTPTTGWRRPPPSWASSSRESWWRTSRQQRRPCPASSTCGLRCCGESASAPP
jgi:hypothetical protein